MTKLRSPRFSISLILLATIFLGAGIPRLQIDASIRTMLVSDDSAYEAHAKFKNWFGSDEVLFVAVPFADGLEPAALELQRTVLHALESIDGVVDVTALVSEDDVVGSSGSIEVRPLVPDQISSLRSDGETLARLRRRVLEHPIWPGFLISKRLDVIAMQVRLDDSLTGEIARDQTMRDIDRVLTQELGADGYFLAGHPFMKAEISRSIGSDLARLFPLAFIVMTVLILIATRSIFVGLSTSVSVLLAVFWMVGLMGWLGLGMTALTNTAPTILVALATACFLHLTAAFQSAPAGPGLERAEIAIRSIVKPTWIAVTTTALGYASLSLSSVPIVREFGLTLAVGVLATGVIATFFLPALLSMQRSPSDQVRFAGSLGIGRVLMSVSKLVQGHPRAILLVGVGVAVSMVLLALQLEVDSSGPRRFAADSRFRIASEFYRSKLSGDVMESIYLTGEEGEFLDPDRLREIQRIEAAALELPQIDEAVSIVDQIARAYWVFRGEVGDPSSLPDSRAAIGQLLLLLESSGDVESTADYISPDRSMVRIVLSAEVESSSVSAQLRSDLSSIVRRLAPTTSSKYSVISTEMLLSRAADVIAVEQLRSAAVALFMVLAVIAVSFRSLRAAGLAILPNVLPILVNLGLMAAAGIALSDATSIISATAIGIAVDSTVHLLSSVRVYEKMSIPRREAVSRAILTTGRPIVVSSLVVVLGFSLLLFSDFASVAELGCLTALTMIYCLLADLLVLPAQLLLSDGGTHG